MDCPQQPISDHRQFWIYFRLQNKTQYLIGWNGQHFHFPFAPIYQPVFHFCEKNLVKPIHHIGDILLAFKSFTLSHREHAGRIVQTYLLLKSKRSTHLSKI